MGKRKESTQSKGAAPSASSAWERLKARPQTVKQAEIFPEQTRSVRPGKCACDREQLETGERFNPWTHGHFTWCAMFQAKCPDCGMSSGTHTLDCAFWDKHPNLTPF